MRACACVQKNSEFYRGALALWIFSVSEVKEAHRISPDFAKISHCEGGVYFKRSPKRILFDENRVLTVGDKTLESGQLIILDQNLILFVVVFDLTCIDIADQSRCVFDSSMQKLLKGQPCPAGLI